MYNQVNKIIDYSKIMEVLPVTEQPQPQTQPRNHIQPQPQTEKQKDSLYMKCMLEMFVLLLPSQIGANGKTKENLRESIEYYIGGKCTVEGYVKPNSVQLVK